MVSVETQSEMRLTMGPSHARASLPVTAMSCALTEDPSWDPSMQLSPPSPQKQHAPQQRTTSLGVGFSGKGGLTRTKSHFSMTSVLSSVSSSSGSIRLVDESSSSCSMSRDVSMDTFGLTIRHHLGDHACEIPTFDRGMRRVMEPYLRQARLQREKTRNRLNLHVDASIASSVGVPYISLRQERPFLFDEHTFPLHTALAETLLVSDLSRIHELDEHQALAPLLDPERRLSFHRVYDNFVTSFCIPLLHSLAIAKNVLHGHSRSAHDCITYRYQAFPSIDIVRPGAAAKPPQCGTTRGHSVGCLFFHVPLTPSQGTAALYVESHPGKEDWHPLQTKSVGLGFLYDGARCLQFGLEHTNNTHASRVSLDFCIMIYRENSFSPSMPMLHPFDSRADTNLCTPDLLEDAFTRLGPGFYEEAFVDINRTITLGADAVIRKSRTLQEPDARVGQPFCY